MNVKFALLCFQRQKSKTIFSLVRHVIGARCEGDCPKWKIKYFWFYTLIDSNIVRYNNQKELFSYFKHT